MTNLTAMQRIIYVGKALLRDQPLPGAGNYDNQR
jgi:hypothetical protein